MRFSRRARRAIVAVATALVGTSLWATPAAAADPSHDPTVYCSAYSRAATAFVFTGYAEAPGHATPPIALRVKCTYTSTAGTYVSETTAPGYVVATAGSGLIGTDPVTVCEEAEALYADGHVGTVGPRCNNVAIPVNPPSIGEVDSGLKDCNFNRQSQTNRWLIQAYAIAPVKSVPVASVAVSCWLTDGSGSTPTISGTTPGPIGVAAGLVSARVSPPTSKCVHMHAVYLDNTYEVSETCTQL